MRPKIVIIFALILILGIFLRFYQLGKIPPSLDWDEASLGWNAYSLLTTGTDEFGYSHPVAIRSFNDYKPPLYVYSLVPVIAVFDKTEFSVRLPSAIGGILTVIIIFFLTRSFADKSKYQNKFALGAMLFASLNPWLVQFSRIAFEANLSLTFFVLGVYLSWHYFKSNSKLWILLISTISFALSIYAYHSSRILVPLFILGVLVLNWKQTFKYWKPVILSAILFSLLLFPIARNAIRVGGLQARFDAVSIFTTKPSVEMNSTIGQIIASPPLYYGPIFLKNWLSHFNFDFLFLNADEIMRHHSPDMGLLLLFDLPLLILGTYFLIKNKPKFLPWLILCIVGAPIASALTTSAPHAVRSLPLAFALICVSSYGLASFCVENIGFKKILVIALAPILLFSNSLYYFHMNFIHSPIEFAPGWQYGYKQMVASVLAVEKNYDHIVVTSTYDQPYIYFLFYGRIAPSIKNNGYFYQSMDKYSFGDPMSLSYLDKDYKSVLYVLGPKDSHEKMKILSTIHFPDGTIAFELAKRIK